MEHLLILRDPGMLVSWSSGAGNNHHLPYAELTLAFYGPQRPEMIEQVRLMSSM